MNRKAKNNNFFPKDPLRLEFFHDEMFNTQTLCLIDASDRLNSWKKTIEHDNSIKNRTLKFELYGTKFWNFENNEKYVFATTPKTLAKNTSVFVKSWINVQKSVYWFLRSCRKTYFCRNLLKKSAHFCKDLADLHTSVKILQICMDLQDSVQRSLQNPAEKILKIFTDSQRLKTWAAKVKRSCRITPIDHD